MVLIFVILAAIPFFNTSWQDVARAKTESKSCQETTNKGCLAHK